MRRIILAFGFVALLATVGVAVAVAAKPGNGQPTGSGTAFLPNPVADLQNQSLTDQKDADYPALAAGLSPSHAPYLDGSGRLVGKWANVVSETGTPAYSPTNEFHYRRNDDRFEQVMAYYWVTEAQRYIQSLGFGSTAAAGEHGVAGPPDQPVGRGQLLLVGQEGHDEVRQGRRRRRRGRRGHPPRVRPRRPGLAAGALRLRRVGRGRRDRRGLRRLSGRHRLERDRAHA